MPTQNSIIYADVYHAFRNLPPKSWMNIVRLYESKQHDVMYLPVNKRVEVMSMYVEALYELRDYEGLAKEVDELIHLSLSEEIAVEVGRIYYEEALFWKANAALHLKDYCQARHILQQLSAMNCADGRYRKRLIKTLYLDKPFWIQYAKALSVLLCLFALLIVMLEILIINNFYPSWRNISQYIRNCMFMGAAIMYIVPQLSHRLQCWWKVKQVD